MRRIDNPIPLFLDRLGILLDGGYIYIGVAGQDPETDPVQVYFDAALSIEADQPLRTRGGAIVNGADLAQVFVSGDDYSIRVRDSELNLVSYVASAAGEAESFQPLDSDLSAIAALSTTAYGRALLTLANQAALRAATGIPDALPLIGGTVSGNIIRSGLGPHLYWGDPELTSGKVTASPQSGGNPTSQPGEIWFGT